MSRESGHLTDEELSASLDRRLSVTERDRVEAHLAGCEDCRRQLAELERTVGLLRTMPVAIPPRVFRGPVDEGGGRDARAPGWAQPGWLRALGSAAAALMLLVLAVDAVLPRMQLGLTDATASSRAPAAPAAPAVAPEPVPPAILTQPVESRQRATENPAARALPFSGAASDAQAPTSLPATDQAVPEEAPARAPAATEAARPATPTAPPRPGQLAGVGLGVLALGLIGTSFLVRRRGG